MSNFPAFRAIRELQAEYEEDREIAESVPMTGGDRLQLQRGIDCRHVDYRYDASSPVYALRDINLHIPANRMTAIVGKSGAGKSTLIDLLMGLIQPESGQVLVDGVSMEDERQLMSPEGDRICGAGSFSVQ